MEDIIDVDEDGVYFNGHQLYFGDGREVKPSDMDTVATGVVIMDDPEHPVLIFRNTLQ